MWLTKRCCCHPLRPMEKFTYNEIKNSRNYRYEAWRCQTCQSVVPLYSGAVQFVRRGDLDDKFYKPKWWLGACPELHDWMYNELCFIVLPFNVLTGWVVRAYRWLRFRKPNKWDQELRSAYIRGFHKGKNQGLRHKTFDTRNDQLRAVH